MTCFESFHKKSIWVLIFTYFIILWKVYLHQHYLSFSWRHKIYNIRPVFPKVRSADHFWSARFSILVRKKKKTYNFYLKECHLIHQNLFFMVRRTTFNDFVVRQNFFQCFMVRKLKKFGKHCIRLWGTEQVTGWELLL